MSRRDGSRLTKSREQLRQEAVTAAAEDMTAIFAVLGKATCPQQPYPKQAPEVVEVAPIANLVTQAAGASGIVAVAANLFERHYTRLEYEATEYDDGVGVEDLIGQPDVPGPFPVGGVRPLIRRRGDRDRPIIRDRAGEVLCLRCGLPMSRHQPGQEDEDETPCPDA